MSASGAEERSSSLRGGAKHNRRKAVFVFPAPVQFDKRYNSCVLKHRFFSLILLILSCTGCGIQVRAITPEAPTALIITATLPPTQTPQPTQTPLPPPPTPTIAPVEGIAATQINVRAEPATVGEVLGILAANTKVQIVGKDPGGNWWQILYPQGKDGTGWVTAQYVTTTGKPEVPVIGGAGSNPSNGNTAIIQQKINIRSGPGTAFNSIGTLNPQDMVNLIGKDANGAWLQIEFPAGPEGKGWVNAAFTQAQNVDQLPIVSDTGAVVGTGTPVDTPQPPTPTLVPAPFDNDSALAPVIDVTFSANGTRSLQYTGDVSSPSGDAEDWLQFKPFTQTIQINLTCSTALTVELVQNQVLQSLTCGSEQAVTVRTAEAYLLHIQAPASETLSYIRYTLTIHSLP